MYRRSTPHYPSAELKDPIAEVRAQARREYPRYTGTYVTGVATINKSNTVPVVASASNPCMTNPKIQNR